MRCLNYLLNNNNAIIIIMHRNIRRFENNELKELQNRVLIDYISIAKWIQMDVLFLKDVYLT